MNCQKFEMLMLSFQHQRSSFSSPKIGSCLHQPSLHTQNFSHPIKVFVIDWLIRALHAKIALIQTMFFLHCVNHIIISRESVKPNNRVSKRFFFSKFVLVKNYLYTVRQLFLKKSGNSWDFEKLKLKMGLEILTKAHVLSWYFFLKKFLWTLQTCSRYL